MDQTTYQALVQALIRECTTEGKHETLIRVLTSLDNLEHKHRRNE